MYRSSRNPAYDTGESRRSPRDRSPGRYNDSRDSDQYRSGGAPRRRSSFSDARQNHNSFAANRDAFREPMSRDTPRDPPREPPRGPKGFVDAPPSGPRATSFSSDYRGDFGFRGRGSRGRGRGWREDNRGRPPREVEREYRDRTDRRDERAPPPSFRDDRSRDREWRGRDKFRGRRSPPPPSRPRSPNYGPRDAPTNLDLDHPRRDSRDGPLSAVSPSDSLQSFPHGYGRGRGVRGRGRGGYYDDYHRARSRSPDPARVRKAAPSATPPPQVPAFGSTSVLPVPATTPTIPAAPVSINITSPVPGVVVPTAPRSLRVAQARSLSNAQPTSKDSPIKLEPFETQPPRAPSAMELNAPKGHSVKSDSRFEDAMDRGDSVIDSTQKLAQKAQQTSPTPSWTEFDRRRSSQISYQPPEATTPVSIREPTPKPVPEPEPEPQRQRRPILGRRPAEIPMVDSADEASDSDSCDDFGDDYFEEEITKVEAEIAKASDISKELVPRLLDVSVFYLRPFIDPPIVDRDATKLLEAKEPCVPTPVEKEPTPEPMVEDFISPVKPKARGKAKSRPETPGVELESNERLMNGTETLPSLGSPAPEPLVGPRDSTVASILQPKPTISRRRGSRFIPEPLGDVPSTRSITDGKRPFMEKSEESDNEMQTEEEKMESLRAVRNMMHTPPLSSLPNFNVKLWHQDDDFLKTLKPDPAVAAQLRSKREIVRAKRTQEKAEEQQRWKTRYLQYRIWTDFSEDPACVQSRDTFAKKQEEDESNAAQAIAAPSITETKPEPQRRIGSRFATEHDFERVLRESEREAKEIKEREDRLTKVKSASSKEATIPDMAWDEDEWMETQYADKTHIVPFERSFARMEFGEPIDNFTPEECELFEKAYLEVPKQWGKIAEALPQREYKACIQHYYLVKHASNLKEKLKKKPKRRRRGPTKGANPKSSALITDLERTEEVENGLETDNGVSRRPRRAAAPTWDFQEAATTESKGVSPAATPARKTATPKIDPGTDAAPTKKRAKVTREKSTKQAKSNQVLAAAPVAASRGPDSPATPSTSEWKAQARRGSTAIRFPPFDGQAPQVQPNFTPPYIPDSGPITVNFDNAQSRHFPVSSSERLGSAPPMSVESTPPDRRSTQQTSSYWSVPEQNEFPALLRHFGTDWHGIAKWMTSKTHIMVKNYYQRQVDSGKMAEWQKIAVEADQKRERGEPTGPLPQPLAQPKRRYDVQASPIPRSNSAIDSVEDISSTSQAVSMSQASSPQPSLSTRFPALAQAGPVPQSQSIVQPPTPTPMPGKTLKQSQQTQQSKPPRDRGPALGFFNTDAQRPILQATAQPAQPSPRPAETAASQRSVMVAQEAELERQKALRIEQQQAIQRERQLQMKQETEAPNVHQFEQFSAPTGRPNIMAHARSDSRTSVTSQPRAEIHTPVAVQARPEVHSNIISQREAHPLLMAQTRSEGHSNIISHQQRVEAHPLLSHIRPNDQSPPEVRPEIRRTAPPEPPYQPRNPALRNPPRDIAEPQRMSVGPPPGHRSTPSGTLIAPPMPQEQRSAPPQQPPPRQDTVRKTSNIMSLLNDESNDRPTPSPPKRVNDVTAPPLLTSRTPPPSQCIQTSRYVHQPISQHSSQAPSHQHQQQAQVQSSYNQQSPHPMHQQPSSLGPNRSYTPTNYERPGFAPTPQMSQQQQMYSQHQSIASQGPSIRREPSLTELPPSGAYSRNPTASQPSMRLKESPYSATLPPQTSQARQPLASPMDQPSEREYYPRQSQYLMQQPSSTNPQFSTPYHPQQASHRQLAFSQNRSHAASPPPNQFPPQTQQPLTSRHSSFDGRYPSSATSATSPQPHFPPQQQSRESQMSMGYQGQGQQQNRPYGFEIERRMEADRERLRQEEKEREDRRRMEFNRDRRTQEEVHYRQRMEEGRR